MTGTGSKYRKVVEWSEEDGCFVGTCPDLMYGGVHGSDEMIVYRDLCKAANECARIMRRKETIRQVRTR